MDMGVLHLDSSQIQGSMVWSLEAVSRLFGFRRVPQANCCFTGHYPKRFNKDVQPILHVWIQEIGITSTGNKREDGPQVIIAATKQNNYFQINSWISAKKTANHFTPNHSLVKWYSQFNTTGKWFLQCKKKTDCYAPCSWHHLVGTATWHGGQRYMDLVQLKQNREKNLRE